MPDPELGSRFLRWERRGPVAWVTIDRPERRNALTSNMYFGVLRAVEHLINKVHFKKEAARVIDDTPLTSVTKENVEAFSKNWDKWLPK